MNRPRPRRTTKLLVLLIASALAFCVLEAGVRILKPFGNRLRGNLIELPVLMRFQWGNAVAGSKLTPQIVNSRNSLGFRGPEPSADFAARHTVIAVGGSTTECLMLNDGESWPEVLGTQLAPRFPSLWVNNAGQDGHSTFGHTMLVQQHLRQLRPDVCLLLVGLNDIGRVDLSSYDASIDSSHSALLRRLLAQSELVSLARAFWRTHHASAMGLGHAQHDLRAMQDRSVADDQRRAEVEFHRARCLAPYRARLLALLQLTRDIPSQPILLTQPALYGDVTDPTTHIALGLRAVDTDYLDGAGTRHLNSQVSWEILELYNDVTREVARDTHTELVELARTMPKDSALYYDWVHYTAQGAREVARIVGARLANVLPARG